MELLLIPIALICFGAFLGLGISIALGAVTILGTILVAILSFFSNFIGLSLALILVSLYFLLPTTGFVVVLVGFIIFFVVAWFAADDEAVKDDLAKKGIKYKDNGKLIEKYHSKAA